MTQDLDHLRSWVGRTETIDNFAAPAPLRASAATLDRNDSPVMPAAPLPACWHWLYFLPATRQSEIGLNGHPRRGGFLPLVPLPSRFAAEHIAGLPRSY
ncbi:hypothetical protein [Paraburkholderia sacchari]|uniref:hypothetical protein n=1 Tax=Paraburkholderia sacchari TaxID=159450 RepID=UPI000541C815|nr:hypothetical protein [Paraburkholderia sacchari]NLP62077.1 hypothetical protein [Paraburkholderia sacchari]